MSTPAMGNAQDDPIALSAKRPDVLTRHQDITVGGVVIGRVTVSVVVAYDAAGGGHITQVSAFHSEPTA